MRLVLRLFVIATLGAGAAAAEERILESVIAPLGYGGGCSSVIRLANVSEHPISVEVEGHRESGGLTRIAGVDGNTVRLGAHESGTYKLDIAEETDGAWARVKERRLSPDDTPTVAITAAMECVFKNELRSEARSVVFPMRNPWFDGDVAGLSGDAVSLINVSEAPVRATGCYSSGGLYSTGGSELRPVCNDTISVQVPPFGSRQFPVSKNGSTHFSLRTRGERVVLEMLRPGGEVRRVYRVDSSIRFGEEVER
jgi:hypothetical protein